MARLTLDEPRVSIHAPVMDANSIDPQQQKMDDVSIHAPVMDANYHLYLHRHRQSFNPRARDGRENRRMGTRSHIDVSIHAPVMDANAERTGYIVSSKVSIHAPVMDAKLTP